MHLIFQQQRNAARKAGARGQASPQAPGADQNQRSETETPRREGTMHSRKHPSQSSKSESTMREEPAEDAHHPIAGGGAPEAETEKLLPLHRQDADAGAARPAPPTQAKKIGTALFYACSSLGVIFANKIVLSTYQFPSVQTLALLQFASTTTALKVASALGYVHLLPISVKGIKSILPLSTCYLLNILTGLSATQNLSLPMMVLLRRASILMTMVRGRWRGRHVFSLILVISPD